MHDVSGVPGFAMPSSYDTFIALHVAEAAYVEVFEQYEMRGLDEVSAEVEVEVWRAA